jgi:hypothetical protein
MNDETKNNIKIIVLLIVVFIILYFLHITIEDRFEDQYDDFSYEGETQIIFSKDITNKTLTVTEFYSQGSTLHWPQVAINNGSATLPFGTIDVGDVITNCEGYLELIWGDTGIHIISTDFN